MRESVKFINAVLQETEEGEIILRGVITPECLKRLLIGTYQRKVLYGQKRNSLLKTVSSDPSALPDIILGMRGGNYEEISNYFCLYDPIYNVDGVQRVAAAITVMETGKMPLLGAKVHFNTTEAWEKEKFDALNTKGVKLSPNILIRNKATDYAVIGLLQMLCHDNSFVLYDKVNWEQYQRREQLIHASTLVKTVGMLHMNHGATRATALDGLLSGVQQAYEKIGRAAFRENTKLFWNIVEECFSITAITYKSGATAIKLNFLLTLAKFFALHAEFWDNHILVVEKSIRNKIATFPIQDPHYSSCAGSSKGANMLFELLLKHVNSGKRTKRLITDIPRDGRKARKAAARKL